MQNILKLATRVCHLLLKCCAMSQVIGWMVWRSLQESIYREGLWSSHLGRCRRELTLILWITTKELAGERREKGLSSISTKHTRSYSRQHRFACCTHELQTWISSSCKELNRLWMVSPAQVAITTIDKQILKVTRTVFKARRWEGETTVTQFECIASAKAHLTPSCCILDKLSFIVITGSHLQLSSVSNEP